MSNIKRIAIAFLALTVAIMSALAVYGMGYAAGTTDTSVLVLKATDCSDSMCAERFQFKVTRTVKSGYTINFLIHLYQTDGVSVGVVGAKKENVGVTEDPSFIQEALGTNENVKDAGDGWYYVSAEVAGYAEDGSVVDKYSSSYFYVKIKAPSTEGCEVMMCKLSIVDADGNIKEYNTDELQKYTSVLYDRPIFEKEVRTVAVPNEAFANVVEKEPDVWKNIDAGEFWNPDPAPYTWTVDPRGAQGLPAVVLGATGGNNEITNVNDQLIAALTSTTFVQPNNLIFAFSDGFGFHEITLAEHYAGNMIMNDMPYHGSSATASINTSNGKANVTTDSAAGGTALSSGYKTVYGYEGLDKYKNRIPCIGEVLREKYNKIIGDVTIGWAYDATPADFGGAHAERGDSSTIAKQMMTFAPDLWIGEGMDDYESTFKSLKKSVLADQDIGFYEKWSQAMAATHDKMWIGIADKDGYEIRYNTPYANLQSVDTPTISMVTAYALTWLQAKSKANNDVGFYMMFENGQTDAAGHANSVVDMIGEAHATDEMVAVVLKFACENPDTIVVFSDDHETGGLVLREGWETDFSKAKYTTTGHSRQDVPVFAIGYEPLAKLFDNMGMINAHVGKLMGYVMGLTDFGAPVDEYPEYDIASIIDGTFGADKTTSDVTADEAPEKVATLDGAVLNIKMDPAQSTQKIIISGLTVANHDMLTMAYSVPKGAKHITVYGGDSASMNKLLDEDCDGEKNFVAAAGNYFATFKADEDFTQLVIELTGTFAEGDSFLMDNLVIGTIPTIEFDKFDVSTVSGGAGASITDKDGNPIDVQPVETGDATPAPDGTGNTAAPAPNDGSGSSPVVPIVVGVCAVVVIAAVALIVIKAPKKK